MLKQIPKLYLTPELQTGIAFCSDGNAFSQYVIQLPPATCGYKVLEKWLM